MASAWALRDETQLYGRRVELPVRHAEEDVQSIEASVLAFRPGRAVFTFGQKLSNADACLADLSALFRNVIQMTQSD